LTEEGLSQAEENNLRDQVAAVWQGLAELADVVNTSYNALATAAAEASPGKASLGTGSKRVRFPSKTAPA